MAQLSTEEKLMLQEIRTKTNELAVLMHKAFEAYKFSFTFNIDPSRGIVDKFEVLRTAPVDLGTLLHTPDRMQ